MKSVLLTFALILITSNLTPLHAETKRVIVLETMPVKTVTVHADAFTAHLEKLFSQSSESVVIERLEAKGSKETAQTLLRKALQKKTDLVFTVATLAAQAGATVLKNTKTPMLFAVVADPVGSGILAKENAPSGTNISGRIYSLHRDTKIKFIHDVLEDRFFKPFTIGLVHSDYPSSIGENKQLRKLLQVYPHITVVDYTFPYHLVPAGLNTMLKEAEKGIRQLENAVDFWWFLAGPLGESDEYMKLFRTLSTKPVIMGLRKENTRDGALLAVNPDFVAGGEEIAELAYKVMQGEDIGSIPVIPSQKYNVSVNVDTAVQMGVVIPMHIMELTGGKVYRK